MSIEMRRHHRKRLMNNRKYHHLGLERVNDPVRCAKYVSTPTPCSCYACGNPRKWWKQKTRQELKFEISCQAED